MAGTFVHIVLVDSLCMDAGKLNGIGTLPNTIKQALMVNPQFCELGAISPDAPYLKLLNADAARWANVMHYWKPADFIRHAIPLVHEMDWRLGPTKKCMAWLFGYTAHVVTDMTIHPVIERRVGNYEDHKQEHRECEMHQDVFIFNKRKKRDLNISEYLTDENGGIASCAMESDEELLEPSVRQLWSQCLNAFPLESIKMKNSLKRPQNPPNPDEWFDHYVTMIDKFAEEGGKLPWLTRHIAEAQDIVFPQLDDLDTSYVEGLRMPDGTTTGYEDLFDRTAKNIATVWQQLGTALDSGNKDDFKLENGDLDTGRADSNNNLVFWNAS